MKEEISKREYAEIEVGRINPSPYQHRKNITDIEGLAENIRRHGILNPLTVRFVNGDYELIAGHRRLEAAELVGFDTVPAIVIVCDDREAAEMCVTENMQRCNLTPLEEADGVAALLSTGHEIQDVADRLGRSRQWVARRAGLLKLCAIARKEYESLESPICLTPVEGLEMIAAMPEDVQVHIVSKFATEIPTLANIKHALADVMADLANAPFETSSCKGCPKRTGAQPDLFGEVAEGLGQCLDSVCFTAKRKKHLRIQIEGLWLDDPNAIVISESSAVIKDYPAVLQKSKLEVCSKKTKGAVMAFEVNPSGEVNGVWVVEPKKEDAIKKNQAEIKKLTKDEPTDEEYVIGAVVKMLSDVGNNPIKNFPPEKILLIICADDLNEAMNRELADAIDIIWSRIRGAILRRLEYDQGSDCEIQYEHAKAVAKVLYNLREFVIIAARSSNEI